jgi:hypothetical protein
MIFLDIEITKKLHARTKTPNTPWLLHHSYENPSWLPRIDSSSEEGEKRFIEVFDFFCEKGIGTTTNQSSFLFQSSGTYNRRSSTADTACHLCCNAATQKETITSSCNPQTPEHKTQLHENPRDSLTHKP